MKPRSIIVLLVLIAAGVGGWQFLLRREPPVVKPPSEPKPSIVRPPETPAEREARWSQEAKTAFVAAITNTFPGYKRTVRTEENIVAGQPVSNWTASAVVEYVDQNGNFNRTTLFWRFGTNADSVRIIPVTY